MLFLNFTPRGRADSAIFDTRGLILEAGSRESLSPTQGFEFLLERRSPLALSQKSVILMKVKNCN